jgi:hypothetical protein
MACREIRGTWEGGSRDDGTITQRTAGTHGAGTRGDGGTTALVVRRDTQVNGPNATREWTTSRTDARRGAEVAAIDAKRDIEAV